MAKLAFEKWNFLTTGLFFAIPGLLMAAGMWWLNPLLQSQGLPMWTATFVSLWLPVIVMVLFVLYKMVLSQRPLVRWGRLSTRQWLIVLAAFLIVQALEFALSETRGILDSLFYFVPREGLPPVFLPNYTPSLPIETFFAIRVPGNPWVLLFWSAWLIVNIGGEEILWRGYALPRMEAHFGKWAWLVNGLAWNVIIHAFMPWAWLSLLPISLALPYLAQRYQSIWPGVFIHGVGNGLMFILLGASL